MVPILIFIACSTEWDQFCECFPLHILFWRCHFCWLLPPPNHRIFAPFDHCYTPIFSVYMDWFDRMVIFAISETSSSSLARLRDVISWKKLESPCSLHLVHFPVLQRLNHEQLWLLRLPVHKTHPFSFTLSKKKINYTLSVIKKFRYRKTSLLRLLGRAAQTIDVFR